MQINQKQEKVRKKIFKKKTSREKYYLHYTYANQLEVWKKVHDTSFNISLPIELPHTITCQQLLTKVVIHSNLKRNVFCAAFFNF